MKQKIFKLMRQQIKLFMVMVILMSLVACAGQQITKDQEARILLNSIQDNLAVLFDTGLAMSKTKPEYQVLWKAKINPAFDVANKAVKSAMELAKEGKYTPADVNAKITPLVNSVIVYLAQIGVIK